MRRYLILNSDDFEGIRAVDSLNDIEDGWNWEAVDTQTGITYWYDGRLRRFRSGEVVAEYVPEPEVEVGPLQKVVYGNGVYLDPDAGDDKNDGKAWVTAKKTLAAALEECGGDARRRIYTAWKVN